MPYIKKEIAGAVLAMIALACLHPARAAESETNDASNIVFDVDILRDRGLNDANVEYFGAAPRFRPGSRQVDFMLNGLSLGNHDATFDQVGSLCFTTALAAEIGILIPEENRAAVAAEKCPPIRMLSPRFEVVLYPDRLVVDITVPPESVLVAAPVDRSRHGGWGGLVNYRFFGTTSINHAGGRTSFQFLDTEAGLNGDDWLLRARQNLSVADGIRSLRFGSVFVQKTFVEQRRILQAGLIGSLNPIYPGIPLRGVQWTPEAVLEKRRNYPLEGVVSGRSRVELWQAGALLYTTYVPAGYFTITEYPLRSVFEDLEMRIIDEAGVQKTVTVPSSALLLAADQSQAEGLSVAAGRLWNQQARGLVEEKATVVASYGIRIRQDSGITAGAVASRDFLGWGATGYHKVSPAIGLGSQLFLSHDRQAGLSGASVSGSLGFRSEDLPSVGLSTNLRTRDFRSVQQSAVPATGTGQAYSGSRMQTTATLSVPQGWARGLNASFSRESYFVGPARSTYSIGWGFPIRRASLQLGISRTVAGADPSAAGGGVAGRTVSLVYAALVVPLGPKATSNSTFRSSGDTSRISTGINQTVNDYLGYQAVIDRSASADGALSHFGSLSASLSPRYTAVGMGVSQGPTSRGLNLSLGGSMVATSQGVAFSQFEASDTYGMVKVGDVSGVKVETQQGAAWSGWGGLAALPALPAFQSSRVEVRTTSLATDQVIDNGLFVIEPARGAVVTLNVGLHRVRRVLLLLTDENGIALPVGLAVSADGELMTTVGRGGEVLISLPETPAVWTVGLPGGGSCILDEIRTSPRAPGRFFETAYAICRSR